MPRRPMPEWMRNVPPAPVPQVSPAPLAAFQPVSPVGTGLYGVDAAGQTWQYAPPGVVPLTQPGGPFLPLSGGQLTGPLLLAGNATAPLQPVPLQQLPEILLPAGGDIQQAINQLPATGGKIVLSPNTTYVVTTAILSYTPNVHISASGWGTVIQRGPALSGVMLSFQGTGCLIEGVTFDGNGGVNTGGQSEVDISGANSRITNCQVINSASVINMSVQGAGCRVDHCTITGLGISLSTQRGYGVWAINHVPVTIDHNTITGTGIDAVGVDGPGTVVDGNYIAGCHCWSGSAGAQLAVYPLTTTGPAVVVSDNFIGQGGAATSGGMEIDGNNVAITGNTILNQYGGAIGIDAGHGYVITGNLIQNVGLDGSGNADGIVIQAGVTDFVISGNRIGDDNATPTMRFCVAVQSGASDRYTIVGNHLGPNSNDNNPISDGGTGRVKVIAGNTGTDTVIPPTYSAAELYVYPSQVGHLYNSGTTTITSITGGIAAGAVKILLPNAAFTFEAGNNINNTVTTTANVPLIMACDENGNWWLK